MDSLLAAKHLSFVSTAKYMCRNACFATFPTLPVLEEGSLDVSCNCKKLGMLFIQVSLLDNLQSALVLFLYLLLLHLCTTYNYKAWKVSVEHFRGHG